MRYRQRDVIVTIEIIKKFIPSIENQDQNYMMAIVERTKVQFGNLLIYNCTEDSW